MVKKSWEYKLDWFVGLLLSAVLACLYMAAESRGVDGLTAVAVSLAAILFLAAFVGSNFFFLEVCLFALLAIMLLLSIPPVLSVVALNFAYVIAQSDKISPKNIFANVLPITIFAPFSLISAADAWIFAGAFALFQGFIVLRPSRSRLLRGWVKA